MSVVGPMMTQAVEDGVFPYGEWALFGRGGVVESGFTRPAAAGAGWAASARHAARAADAHGAAAGLVPVLRRRAGVLYDTGRASGIG